MKSYLFAAIIFSSVTYKKCNKSAGTSIPTCIQSKIDKIKAEPRWNPPATVEEYKYDGRRVFLFSANCCDQFNQAFDEQCNYICAPSGGYTGKGDGKCPDFKEKAQFGKLVWKDDRK